VAELLAIAPTLDEPVGRARLRDALGACAQVMQGNVDAFARRVRLYPVTVGQWYRGSVPRLDSLLELTRRLGVNPRQCLVEGFDAMRACPAPRKDDGESAAERLSPRRVPFDDDGVRRALEAFLVSAEDPPPSLREMARRLGLGTSEGLYRRFPELCRAIAARYLAGRRQRTARRQEDLRHEVRQVVATLHAQGLYPSANRVHALLRQPPVFRHPVVRAAWVEALRELGWEPGRPGSRNSPRRRHDPSSGDL
jgi:hypothetical protein